MLKIAWSSFYAHPLPPGHRFPMEKYNLVPEQLKYEGTLNEENFFEPKELDTPALLLAHHPEYWRRLETGTLTPQEMRRTGFPWSERLILRERIIMQGTVDAAYYGLENGIGMNVSGGTHHAFSHKGEGFCLLNDIAIAALSLLKEGKASKILVVDLDVHQGDGTAEILQHEKRAFTFSMHCGANFPLVKQQSSLDIPLPIGTDDKKYLSILEYELPKLIDIVQPDFAFYLSGVDVLATDKLGKLALTRQGCKARDRFVLKTFHDLKIPVAVSLGGGYSHNLIDIVEAHCNTFRLAQEIWF